MTEVMEILKSAPVKKEQVSSKEGLSIVTVGNSQAGLLLAKDILYKEVDDETVLFLSGGSTPKDLYRKLAEEAELRPKIVGLVDERADGSNFAMIEQTGLIGYFESLGIKCYPIITQDLSKHPEGAIVDDKTYTNSEFAALRYNRFMGKFIDSPSHTVAIVGIGEDGHTAGIAPNREDFRNPLWFPRRMFDPDHKIVDSFRDVKGMDQGGFGERITLTLTALAKMDFILILAFGEKKRGALKKMFERSPVEEIPARFYITRFVAPKTLLITDQKI